MAETCRTSYNRKTVQIQNLLNAPCSDQLSLHLLLGLLTERASLQHCYYQVQYGHCVWWRTCQLTLTPARQQRPQQDRKTAVGPSQLSDQGNYRQLVAPQRAKRQHH